MSDFEERLAKLELRVEANAGAATTIFGMQRDRLNEAQERIAALERKVAELKAPGPESLDDPEFYAKLDVYMRARSLGYPTPLPKKTCATCGASPSDSFTTAKGHFLVNDEPCPEEKP